MLDYLANLLGRLGHWSYAIVFLAACAETAAFLGLIVPGESLVILSGFLAKQGVFDLDALIVTVAVGAALGDTIGYALGHHLGRDWLLRNGRRFGLRPKHLERVDGFFARHGGKTVLIGRFIGFLRALAPFTVGTSRMRYRQFLPFDLAGAILWATACVLVGYFLGAGWQVAEKWIGRASAIIGGALLLALVLGWMWRWIARHETELKERWARLLAHPSVVALRRQFAPQLAFVQQRFSPQGYLGLHLTIGALVMIVATWIFGGITEDILTGDPLAMIDGQLATWLHERTTPGLTKTMLAVSWLHAPAPITVCGLIFALWLSFQKRWHLLVALLLTLPGGALLNVLLKHALQRNRPLFENPIVTLHSYSFPSGHTMGATLFYGMVAACVFSIVPSWRWRTFAVLAAFFVVIIVGFSRVYLGAHYLSDVLAAMAAGVAWLAICLTGVETVRRRQLSGLEIR